MTDNKDNSKKPESTSESSPDDNTQASKKSVSKKGRLKFEKKDMYEIKYNF